jgi:hypothetical protein
LFGHVGHVESVTEATVIERVRLVGVQVIGARGSGTLIGRVTGNANTRIKSCCAMNGHVRGDGATGGLIGSHNSYRETPGGDDNPVTQQCYADIDVLFSGQGGADKFGGLAGCSQKGTLSNCFAHGSVTATNATRIGGLAGCIDLRGELVRCYSTGSILPVNCTLVGGLVGNLAGAGSNIGVVTDCFWDQERSGMGTSAGGTGKTTAQMKNESTFTSANWLFPAIWLIEAAGVVNNGYPFLTVFLINPVENRGFAMGAVRETDGAADSPVPVEWNIGPMRDGAWREDFEGVQPAWVSTVGTSAVTTIYPALPEPALPARSNRWFDPGVRALRLDVPSGVLSNRTAYTADGGGGPLSSATHPLHIESCVCFDSVAQDTQPANLPQDWLLGFTLDSQNRLVAVHGAGSTNSAATFETGVWHRVTLRVENGTYGVRVNGSAVFDSLALREPGTGQIGALCFRGTGWADEMYVSHGSPDYPVRGPTNPVPAVPLSASNPPTDEERTRLNVWLQNEAGIGVLTNTVFNMTGDQLADCYLIGELDGTSETALPARYTFGISSIEMVSPLRLQITVRLLTGKGNKEGAINGRIRIQGKIQRSESVWRDLPGAITTEAAHFTNGHATYPYAIPPDGYRFFRAQIVP